MGAVTDIFAVCRHSLPALQAAEYYGIEVKHNGMACCPFHPDKTPSMKLDSRFHCFGCQADGDVIDFTARLFGLPPLQAVKKLDLDFNLGLDIGKPITDSERLEARRIAEKRQKLTSTYEAFQTWKASMERQLNRCICIANCALKQLETPDDLGKLTAAQAVAIQWRESLESWADCLQGNMDEQMFVFRQRKEVDAICKRILKNSQTKSAAA